MFGFGVFGELVFGELGEVEAVVPPADSLRKRRRWRLGQLPPTLVPPLTPRRFRHGPLATLAGGDPRERALDDEETPRRRADEGCEFRVRPPDCANER